MTLIYNLTIQRIGKALRGFHLHLPGLTVYHNVFQLLVIQMLTVGVGRENLYKAQRLWYTWLHQRLREGLRMRGMVRKMAKYRVAVYTQFSFGALCGIGLPIFGRPVPAARAV